MAKTRPEKIDETYELVLELSHIVNGVNGFAGLIDCVARLEQDAKERQKKYETEDQKLHDRITANDLAVRKDTAEALEKLSGKVVDMRVEVAKIAGWLAASGIIGASCYYGLQ